MVKYISSKNTHFRATILPPTQSNQYTLQQENGPGFVASHDEITKIDTSGADGKAGKRGADGENGHPGASGALARLDPWGEHRGTNGEPGSHATDGEPGTNGDDGQDAGDVEITFNHEDDRDLLDALQIVSKGGAGGLQGSHGQGGQGGKGGKGGASLTYWLQVPYVHYQGCGNAYYTTCSYDHVRHFHRGHSCPPDIYVYNQDLQNPPFHYGDHEPHIDYVWVQRTISGGRPGQNGRDGQTHKFPLSDGRPGRDGRVTYYCGAQRYDQRYQFKFRAVTIGGTPLQNLPQRKFEYGDVVEITDITLSNPAIYPNLSHTMSTPKSNRVQLHASAHIQPQKDTHVPEITAHAEAICDTSIRFEIKPSLEAPTETPKSESVPLQLSVCNPRLKRSYQEASQRYTISVGYPVYLAATDKHVSVFSGDCLVLPSQVMRDSAFQNIANDSRQFTVRRHRGHETRDSQTTQTDWQEVFVTPDPLSVSNEALHTSLWWPKLDTSDPSQYVEIQRQTVNVQVTPRYEPNQSGYLLVINAETNPALIKTWYARLQKLAYHYPANVIGSQTLQAIPIWNVSAYGYFDLNPLIKNTQNGTIVILDNAFQTQYSSFGVNEFHLRLAGYGGVSLIHVGDTKNAKKLEALDEKLVLSIDSTSMPVSEYQSIHPLMNVLFRETVGNQEIYSLKLQLSENKVSFVEKMRRKLEKIFPNRRYAVDWDQANATVSIQRVAAPCVFHVDSPNDDLALIQAASFLQKLQTIFKYETAPHEYHQHYLGAILKDLNNERQRLAASHNFYSLHQSYYHDFSQELICLQQLIAHVNTMNPTPRVAFTPVLIQVMVAVQYEAQSHTSFWTWLASFFIAQNDEKLKTSTLCLSNQILDVTGTEKVTLQLKLKHYLAQRHNHSFFRPGCPEDFDAAETLLNACERSDMTIQRTDSKRLQAFYAEFDRLYASESPSIFMQMI